MTTKEMFSEILKRLDGTRLPVAILRETTPQLEFPATIRCPQDIHALLHEEMAHAQQEMLVLLCLNAKNHVTWKGILFVGTLNSSVIHSREIFRHAIEQSAASIIIAHNHPSGQAEPSAEDIKCSQQIAEAGKLLNIPLLDHVVIGSQGFVSMKERALLS